jgi:hypothetical protein
VYSFEDRRFENFRGSQGVFLACTEKMAPILIQINN